MGVAGWQLLKSIRKEKENSVKIEMNKKYRRVGTHEPVRVICVDRVTQYDKIPVIALLKHSDGVEKCLYLNAYGQDDRTKVQIIEEVPAVDWSKVKVDTPIWVKFSTGDWLKRHFQCATDDSVFFWPDGRTSFTCDTPRYIASLMNRVDFENCSLEEPQ